jgi:uncharacterized protein (DUF58 family)
MLISRNTLRLLDALALRSKRSFFGLRQGAHRSPRRGHGVEFAEYRNYELGDNPRAIDWNLFSRSDKLYIKRYLEEENVELYVIIDGSRSLTHPDLREKWDLATHIAACASYIALATQDPVTISVLGGPHSTSYWGGRAFGPLTQFIEAASRFVISDTHENIDIAEEARRASTRTRFPGICVVISDFLYPMDTVAAMLGSFRARNMEIHAVQVLGTHDTAPARGMSGATLVDSETGSLQGISLTTETRAMYTALLESHNHALRAHCLANKVSYVSTAVADYPSVDDAAIDTIRRMGLFV